MTLETRNWETLSLGERVRALEVDGYVVFPSFLGRARTDRLLEIFAAMKPRRHAKNSKLDTLSHIQWSGEDLPVRMMAEPSMLEFLRAVLGEDVVCMNGSFSRIHPGYPGMPLHVDLQPYGSDLFGPIASVPVSVRVFYYLDGLTEDCAPLRVIPTSHLSLHSDANPYRRHVSHPDEVLICCPAGSAVVIHGQLFHAAGVNRASRPRSAYTISYRPAWAGPRRRVPPHERSRLTALPPEVRRLFRGPNTRHYEPRLPVASPEESGAAKSLGVSRWGSGGREGTS